MHYPTTTYKANENGSTSTFKGLNRTERGTGGEWEQEKDLDTRRYPCLAPRYAHSRPLPLGGAEGRIYAAAELMHDSGSYEGFTGVVLADDAVLDEEGTEELNFVFMYKGEVRRVGAEPAYVSASGQAVPERTALWIYDADADSLTAEELNAFDIRRIVWSAAACGSRYVINGYDPVLERGRYFVFDTKTVYTNYVTGDELVRLVVPSAAQHEFSDMTFGYRNAAASGYNEYKYINFIKSNTVDFSEYFTEGDYLVISGARRSSTQYPDCNVYPYLRYGRNFKYAVVREIETSSDGNGSTMYFYCTDPRGKFRRFQSSSLGGISAVLGTFIPPMLHITAYGKRIWGVDPVEDCVYSSVFDTPAKLMNTDSTLDNAMSWQTVLGTADRAVGVFGSVSELLVMKRNSIIRVNGTNASSFNVSGIFKNCGCIDIRSCASAAGTVYYLGSNGFYAYDGSQPVIISEKLDCAYISAAGFSDGVKYYASALRQDGEHEFLVYDIRRGVWHIWSDTPEAKGFMRVGSDIYLCSDPHGEFVIDTGGMRSAQVTKLTGGDEAQPWECVSVLHYEGANAQKAVNELWIRAQTDEDIEVYTRVNGGEWVSHKALEPKDRVFMYKVPVRLCPGDHWQYRLKGFGNTVIHSIERVFESGGGRHYVY